MNSYYFLSIPAIIGIIIGIFLGLIDEPNTESVLLTKQKLIENGSPILGNPSAKITIIEFGDYQCTFCFRFHGSSLKSIQQEYIDTGIVNLVFKDFPINGPDSILAAEASHCANDQGKYWEYHDELYTNWGGERTGWITRTSLNQFGEAVGLDLEKFNVCLDENKYRQKVFELGEFAREVGINATPSFLIFNDEKVVKIRGNQPIDSFRQAIDDF